MRRGWRLAAALALAAPLPALAQEEAPPPTAMVDQPCPDVTGLFAWSDWVRQNDWAFLCRYRADNAALAGQRVDTVFIGDSITEFWVRRDPALFGPGRVGRGISGQTSPQMLVRFQQDVIALKPRVVHIMAGTNDLAGNTGPTRAEDWKNALRAMVALARANRIAVVLGSIPPADRFDWKPGLRPAGQIAELNRWLKGFACEQGAVYADYHAVLATPQGALRADFGADGVHPEAAGYAAMRPVAEAALAQAAKPRRARCRP